MAKVNRTVLDSSVPTLQEFSAGGTVRTTYDLFKTVDGLWQWTGTVPKVVPSNSTPESTGGTGTGAWVSIGDASVRADLGVIEKTYSTVTNMKSDVSVSAGDFVKTLGYHEELDRCGAEYYVSNAAPDGVRVLPLENGLSATVINDRSYFLDLSKWGAQDGSDITVLLQAALNYLKDSAKVNSSGRGIVTIPTGWNVKLSGEIRLYGGTGFHFEGSTVTQTVTGLRTFYANDAFYPVGISLKGHALVGPDSTVESRKTSGSTGVYVTGGIPFTSIDLKEVKFFEYGGLIQDSYSSRVNIDRAFFNRVGFKLLDECHATIVDIRFCDRNDDANLLINDDTARSFIHNVTFRGAYQKSKIGVKAIKCYEVWGENIYHEGNSLIDIQFGDDDSGVYAKAAYNCGVRTWQSSSAVGKVSNDVGNFVLKHAIGINLDNLTLLGQATTSHNITYDGYSSGIVANYAFNPSGREPSINSVNPGNRNRLVLSVRNSTSVPVGNFTHLQWKYDDTRIGKRGVRASKNGRPELVDEFIGSNADYRNIVQDRQFFERYDGTVGLTVDHINKRVNLGYTGYTHDGSLITSDPREKYDISECSLGASFCRDLVDDGGVVQYRLKTGDSGRLHYGVRTDVLKSVGLKYVPSTKELGMYAEFDKLDAETGTKTGEKSEAARYVELIAPLLMYVRELERRVDTIEGK